jgi:hypothetical protein
MRVPSKTILNNVTQHRRKASSLYSIRYQQVGCNAFSKLLIKWLCVFQLAILQLHLCPPRYGRNTKVFWFNTSSNLRNELGGVPWMVVQTSKEAKNRFLCNDLQGRLIRHYIHKTTSFVHINI